MPYADRSDSGQGASPEMVGTRRAPPPVPSQTDNRAWVNDRLDPSSPNYIGPGYSAVPDPSRPGNFTLRITDPLAQETWKSQQALGPPPATPTLPPAVPTTPPSPSAPAAPAQTPFQRLQALDGGTTSFIDPRGATRAASTPTNMPTIGTGGAVKNMVIPGGGVPGGSATPQPGDPAPDVDRSRIDPLLRSVSQATSGLMGLAQIEQQASRAEAQLREASQRASLDAIGAARGGNRRDRAFLERQAIAEGQFNQQQVSRDAAVLRAQEEVDRNNLRLAALQAAGQLGLNAGALELDVERLDLESATNWINQEFENHRLGLQLDQQEAERVANFARDMALIEQQYYTLSVQERQHIRDDLTRKYGISEQTRAALAQVDASNDWNWNTFASGLIGGATTGITAGIVR